MLNLSGYKPSDRYMLRSLHGTYYLIPTGQDIAMHHNAKKLNDTGLIIWDAITNGIPMDKLPSVIRQRFTTDGIDMSSVSDEELSDDAYTFIRSLICQSALVTAECTDSRLHSGSTDSLSFDACLLGPDINCYCVQISRFVTMVLMCSLMLTAGTAQVNLTA